MSIVLGMLWAAILFAGFGWLARRGGCAGCEHAGSGPCCGGRPRERAER